jgi:hypothetical protein
MFNSSRGELEFVVPEPPRGREWLRVVDTAADPPDDVREPGTERPVDAADGCLLAPRSLMVLRSAPARLA